MSQFVFQKATKNQLPARICIAGPTGSGKTFTATLEIAPVLGMKILQIDTEHGSGQLYADLGDYDYYRFDPPYDPSRLVEVLKAADEQGYEVIIVDSLSHFWDGEGGTIDIADAAGQRASGNSFAGWKVATPALRHLVDVMLDLKGHLIVTMRSKMEYVLETNDRGKQVPKKVGMAPVMRQGIEYEFALVADMDLDHRMVISKSRCSELADQVVMPHRAKEMTETFKAWLTSGARMADPADVARITSVFDAIVDDEARKIAKKAFFDVYGSPDRLTEAQIEPALHFANTLSVPIGHTSLDSAESEVSPERRPVSKPPAPDADRPDPLEELEQALNAMPAPHGSRCRDEIKRTFGDLPAMPLDHLMVALKMAQDWPVPKDTPEAEPAEPTKVPVLSAKVRGLIAYGRGKGISEQQLVTLASFLTGVREPRPLGELDDEGCKGVTSLVDDAFEGRLVFGTDNAGIVVKEHQPV